MSSLRRAITRVAALFGKTLARDLESELRAHLGILIEENLRRGMSAEEARGAALCSVGGVER